MKPRRSDTSTGGRSNLAIELAEQPVGVVELKHAVLDMIADRFGNRLLGIDVAQMALGWATHVDLVQRHLIDLAQGGRNDDAL